MVNSDKSMNSNNFVITTRLQTDYTSLCYSASLLHLSRHGSPIKSCSSWSSMPLDKMVPNNWSNLCSLLKPSLSSSSLLTSYHFISFHGFKLSARLFSGCCITSEPLTTCCESPGVYLATPPATGPGSVFPPQARGLHSHYLASQ